MRRGLTLSEKRRLLARALYVVDPEDRPDWLDTRLLRPGQVAALFQVSRRTVAEWARTGKLESIITPGGHRRFRAREVKKLIASISRLSLSSSTEGGDVGPQPTDRGTASIRRAPQGRR
jgi:excisionase family DNA binding protein